MQQKNFCPKLYLSSLLTKLDLTRLIAYRHIGRPTSEYYDVTKATDISIHALQKVEGMSRYCDSQWVKIIHYLFNFRALTNIFNITPSYILFSK